MPGLDPQSGPGAAAEEGSMLVATFGPTTAWQGREIIWDLDHFILVGHGRIPAAGLLDYDARGQLVWADPAYRSWAAAVDRWENGGRSSVVGGGLAPAAIARPGAPPAAQAPRRGGVPTWVIVVVVVAGVALVAAIALAIVIPMALHRVVDDFGQDMQVQAGIHTLRTGIEAYAAEHDGRYPGAGELDPVGMARYVTVWPRNPYTATPMTDGGGRGNFRYDVSPDGGAYKLIGYGRGGETVIVLTGGTDDTV
jgi:hypothetical protein